jgi:hypothetical protein
VDRTALLPAATKADAGGRPLLARLLPVSGFNRRSGVHAIAVVRRRRSGDPIRLEVGHGGRHGAELTTVRDNLRQASLSTTFVYLHSDDP